MNEQEQMISAIIQGIIQGNPKIGEVFKKLGEEGTKQVLQIIELKANAGDQNAIQAINILNKKTQVAKLGAKLDYINKLKGICPEGTEKIYLAKGGCMCKQKAEKGTAIKEEPKKMNEVQKFKAACGTKMKKKK